ncbi:MAG TPA: D-glycerate dehydrogenase [Candidatus Hydrogenedentes bacterium]|nr:D-glycerate dehydrogenase [Candidatus Hydrogenedentota bacterium]HPC16563.1 D-glycerate dehydrogenase [Candidatus Hydrogenedentota bacterium]HRT18938.1 D-glycerate dehydrogenase [Candidatus Hydrogenedentota bacterium]HRT64950.1 D-glycerate dehydrogenase [Candidatus Hydrogenedentota bacterium]
MPRVFVTRPIPDAGLKLLHEAFGGDVVVSQDDRPISREALLEGVRGVHGVLSILTDAMDEEVFEAAGPQLKVVANYAVGYNNVDIAAATRRGIVVTNTPGVLTETTADMTWALMMAAARRVTESERYLRAGEWKSWGPQLFLGVDIHGQTLGLFGMGRIGQAMARRARGFDMRVIYHDAVRLPADRENELNAALVEKQTLLAESDFISIHCPLLPETTHAFGAAEFARMKPTAVLVNTARGPIVDEAALAEALSSRRIFAAGLDVYEREPEIHPALLACPNAVLVPHLGSATRTTRARMAEMAAANLIAALSGRDVPNCVNPEVLEIFPKGS